MRSLILSPQCLHFLTQAMYMLEGASLRSTGVSAQILTLTRMVNEAKILITI